MLATSTTRVATPSSTTAPVAECHDLYVTHEVGMENSTMVVQGVDLAIAAGETVSVVGPSGSGKSTLLHTFAGFTRPASGEVRLLEQDITRASQARISAVHRQGVGFVFQSYNLIPSLPVVGNVLLPARFAGHREDKQRAAAILESLGLARQMNQRTGSLSGGQQQRTAIARVLYTKPALVFADEPTGALDTTNGHLVLDALLSLADNGSAVLLVTHDLRAAALAQRAVVLRDGRIHCSVARPTPERLFAETIETREEASRV